MLLSNGMYYKTAAGVIVKVQAVRSGELVAHTADGGTLGTYGAEDHVNGWEPVGELEWKKARQEAKAKAGKKGKKTGIDRRASKKKVSKKTN